MRNELDDEHIPGYPSGWVAIRFIQLFFVISIWLALSVQLLGRPLFGLTSFSLAAAWAGPIFAADTVRRSLRSSYGFCDNYKVFGGVVAGIACLGAVELYVLATQPWSRVVLTDAPPLSFFVARCSSSRG